LTFYTSIGTNRQKLEVLVNPKSDLPQGTLDLLILKVVALGPVHGYAIAQRLEQVSLHVVQVPQGSLYPALHRLENRGLLDAEWKATETGREAKFYRLTKKGRAQLETEAADWERLTSAVAEILRLSEGGAE
jgi:PadR family transcriptional regulator, regulatory protein PadR